MHNSNNYNVRILVLYLCRLVEILFVDSESDVPVCSAAVILFTMY